MQSIERQINAWSDKRPYRMVRQHNSDFTRWSEVLKVTKKPDFERWSLIAGECFHNLRSALDHLVYAVAVHEIDSAVLPTVVKKFAFPITDDSADFKSKFWRIAPLSAAVRTEIEALQPYNRPHNILPPLLGVLRDFDDIDKHRLLQMAIAQVVDGKYQRFNTPIKPQQSWAVDLNREELVDGAEIAAVTIPNPAPNMDYKFSVRLAVTLPHAPGPHNNHRSEVVSLFRLLRHEVTVAIERIRAKVAA
jgi:hypothetical protein